VEHRFPDTLVLGDGIVLRAITPDQSALLFRVKSAERAWLEPWMDVPTDPEQVEMRVRGFERAAASRRAVGFGIWRGDDLLGECNAFDIAEDHGTAEFGYWLSRASAGVGIATRAVEAVVSHVFDNFDVQRAEILTATGNAAARAVAERAGFTLEGVRRQCERVNGRIVDHAIYGLLRSEWFERADPAVS
jgi:ribosomal-protein-serine acetyltransferase